MPKKVTKKSDTETTRAPRAKRSRPQAAAATPALSEEQIRARAYEIFRSGRNPSDPAADWLEAERELQAEA